MNVFWNPSFEVAVLGFSSLEKVFLTPQKLETILKAIFEEIGN